MDRLIYVDNAATTRILPEVLDKMMPYLTEQYGNPSSLYSFGQNARQAIDEARDTVAKYLNCRSDEVFFTSGGSESDNWAIRMAAHMLEKKGKKLKNMQVKDALIIGCMQCVGVLPGVSRSGSTISGALFAGLNRKTAADFSFLMSIPAILGGAVFEIPGALQNGIGDMHWTAVVAGMLVAGITGYFAIKVMIDAIKKKKLTGFVIYTAILGALVLVDQFATHYFF